MVERGRAWFWFAIGLAAIVAGFWKTFIGDPMSNDRWHTLHGMVSLLWVVLLIVQSLLIWRGKHRFHRQLGWASLGLIALLLGSSSYMVYVEIVSDVDFPLDLRLSLIFLDIGFILLFAVTYGLGLAFRRDRRLHARLMGSTILIGLGPALARLYGETIPAMHGLTGALRWAMWTIDAVLPVAILIELRKSRPLWPLPAMLGVFVGLQAGMGWATGDTFATVARAAGAPL